MEDNFQQKSFTNESLTTNITNNSNNNNNNQTYNNGVPKDYTPPKVYVEPCQVEFFYDKFKQCYPMYKNPRGQCLIINIYQINGMPPRRWSDRDTDALKQLFEQLLFNVRVYTDSTHDLTCQNFKNIIKEFSQLSEHEDAQSSIICLMSHGEEGFLTTKEGDKVLLDEIFTMFNNINCPNLAGKPKLFFIQSCRDDPITGPAEDLGIRLSFSLSNKQETDESDGAGQYAFSDNNINSSHLNNRAQFYLSNNSSSNTVLSASNLTASTNSNSQVFYHIPSLCDMLIGYPTQKGFIAYRKPEIGSWYMNAIVQIFSKHSHNTDLCAMLNMVNSLISNEVTNTGKKQMSEFTSKLTKPYFYFFPGLASDPNDQSEVENEYATSSPNNTQYVIENNNNSNNLGKKHKYDSLNSIDNFITKSHKRACYEGCIDNSTFNDEYYLSSSSTLSQKGAAFYLADEQTDSNNYKNKLSIYLTDQHIEFLADKARAYWKHIAREMDLNEHQIVEIDRSTQISNKLKLVINLWLKQTAIQQSSNENNKQLYLNDFYLNKIVKILTICRLNKIKNEFLEMFPNKNQISQIESI